MPPAPHPAPTAPGNDDEAHVVARASRGELDAFDTLVHRYQNRIFNVCFWVLHDRDDAADAAQEAFLRAFKYLPQFRGDSAFGSWLHRIAVNAARDALARRQRSPAVFSAIDAANTAPEPATQEPSPSDLLLRQERQLAVRSALRALPEAHRLIILLFDLQGMSYEEVAQVLELPLGTVKSRLSRARAALREQLAPCMELFDAH